MSERKRRRETLKKVNNLWKEKNKRERKENSKKIKLNKKPVITTTIATKPIKEIKCWDFKILW